MSWLSVSLEVEAGEADALSDALVALGALAADIADAGAGGPGEQPLYTESTTTPAWPRTRIAALFAPDADVPRVVGAAFEHAGVAPRPFRVAQLEDQDWVRASRSQFAPTRITPRLWVVPTRRIPPDPHAVNLLLDPGVAFGTGTHPTTRLCLAWLEQNIHRGDTVIDYGCGSGILAIAALKLGAGAAHGVDIDPQAVLAARRNAVQNQVAAEFSEAGSAVLEPAHVVIANILANPLVVLAPVLAGTTRRGGRVVLSGILREQADGVCSAYHPWCDVEVTQENEGWVLLCGTRR